MKNQETMNEEVLEEIEELEVTSEREDIASDESEEVSETEALELQLEEAENKYLRLLADYENFKRRATLDKESMQKYRSQNILNQLIPVLDNFSLALNIETQNEETETMLKGIDMIYRSLVDALKSEGLVEINAVGEEFDPNFHQAIMMEKDESQSAGIVLEEMQKGYMLKDRVLRPSMVKVNE